MSNFLKQALEKTMECKALALPLGKPIRETDPEERGIQLPLLLGEGQGEVMSPSFFPRNGAGVQNFEPLSQLKD